ncbi:MAG: TonB-dependent receptor [Bacteroidetes bacterium]|nr:TonB-dependent receptor [Bacteroidota bacterium]|tara:strand:- start:3676 stop:6183 length:2508 start_codon:yes stop_codon:yes gene_type:complete
MNKTTLLLFFLGLLLFSARAQKPRAISEKSEVTISGNVIDEETKEPLEYATIVVFSKLKNAVITGGITDSKGDFSIPVEIGAFDIRIEYIGFKTQIIENKRITNDENIGKFSLILDVEALDAVEIIAERTTVEFRLDKKIYNVGKDLTVRGGTVSDVLDNVPSVSVDVEGNVALRGNDDVRILINGKPSGLVGLNSTDTLRQLPAESIERVEVITSPSARYDAEGSAGILNIILRRSKLQGLNGAMTLNTSYPTQAGVSGNINYRTGNLNFFNTTGYSYRETPGNSYNNTEFFNGDNPSTFLKEERVFERERKGLNTNLGVEWYVNKTSSFTASMVYRNSDNASNTTNILDEIGSNNSITRNIRLDPEIEDDKTIQYSLNYDNQFNGDSQHKLTFDFQYEKSEESETSLINQNRIDVENVETREKQDRILLQADYVKPVGKEGQFEMGYRGQFQNLNSDFLVENTNDNGDTFFINTDLSNDLAFSQYVNAFYTQYGNKLGDKFSYLFGIRLEGTRVTIDQETSGDFEKKNYTQLFPTANLAYEISEDASITLGYNRRIRRPRSYFINPFPSRSSATSIFQGNPNLDPSTSDAFDIGYLNRFGKVTLSTSFYFQHATNTFNFITRETDLYYIFETNQTISQNDPDFDQINDDFDLVPIIKRGPVNLATNDRFGFEFTLSYRPTKKWNLNGNFNVFQSITRGDFEEQNFDAENLSWFMRLNNKYTLPGEIDWQTRLFYRGPNETAQSISTGVFSTDLAFSKDLFEEKASLALRVSDLFNSRKRISESFTSNFRSDSEFQWRQRTYTMSFTYRFNQQKNQRQRRGGQGNGEQYEMEGT